MKYTKKERDKYCDKFYIRRAEKHNLVPYKYKLESYEGKSIELDYLPSHGEIEVDGIFYNISEVIHQPKFKEIYLSVENFLSRKKEHGLGLDDISIWIESHHYMEDWDGPFEEIQINVTLPRAVEEIEAAIDKCLERKRKEEETAKIKKQKTVLEEKQLLEDLKRKYE